jgi:glycosyltransferase involved in cell wall biosynthesis
MKVILLSDPASAHTIKWANGIHAKGVEVLVYGLTACDLTQYDKGIEIEVFKIPEFVKWQNYGNLLKSIYLLSVPRLRKLIKKYKCDILHSQSVSSYGMIGALSGFHPHVMSVWGNDVYVFPYKHKLLEKILRYNLSTGDVITSSSKTMAKYSQKFVDKEILVTPGGIMMDRFKPMKRDNSFYSEDEIVIGTVKMMEKKYGSEDILDAFNILKKRHPSLPLKLLMVGRGSLIEYLTEKAKEYKISDSVTFTGNVPFDQVPKYQNMLDIYLAPSTDDSESFGVGILEASACGKPVIVSNIGGLPEVVIDNHTGFMVPPNNPQVLAEKIEVLVIDKKTRLQFGENGRRFVEEQYNYDKITDYIVSIYESALKK